jgi:hypothetical protein
MPRLCQGTTCGENRIVVMRKVKVVKRKVAQQGYGLLWLSSEKLQGRVLSKSKAEDAGVT